MARRRRSWSGSVGVLLVGAVFLIAGAYLFYDLTARPLAQAVASRDWTAASCGVIADNHELVYWHDGYTGRRITFTDDAQDRHRLWDRLHRLIDQSVPCWFDPEQPRQMVLERQGWGGLWGFAGAAFALVGLQLWFLELRPRTGPSFWWGTMDNLGHAEVRLGSLRWVLVTTLLVLLMSAIGVALVLQPAPGSLLVLVPASGAVLAWLYALSRYFTRLTVSMNSALVVGKPPRVHVSVRTLLGTTDAGATLVAAEEIATGHSASNPRRRVLAELQLEAAIPATLPGSQGAGPHRIVWTLDTVGPSASIPVTVAWPVTSRSLSSEDTPPPGDEGSRLRLLLDRRRAYAPDDDIEGVVRLELDAPPKAATLRLAWRSRADLAAPYVYPVIEIDVADLPRKGRPRASDLPYREAALPDESGPLAASEQRRLRIPVPYAPRTYSGDTLTIEWFLELTVDDNRIEVPIMIS